MKSMSVRVEGVINVPINANVVDSMREQDRVLCEEVVMEAAKIAVGDKLGGFSEMQMARQNQSQQAPRQCDFVATVDFDSLSSCIERLQREHDRILGIVASLVPHLETIRTILDRSEGANDAKPPLQAVLEGIKRIDLQTDPDTKNVPPENTDLKKSPKIDDAGSHSSKEDWREEDGNPEDNGYQRLLDPADDDAEDSPRPPLVDTEKEEAPQ